MRYTILLLTLLLSIPVWSQDQTKTPGNYEKTKANSFVSRENLTRYYRAAIDSKFFSENEGEVRFDASVFGIAKIFDPGLSMDTAWTSGGNRALRNLELGIGLTKNENDKINKISPQVKYAILNRRDYKKGTSFDYDFEQTRLLSSQLSSLLQQAINEHRDSLDTETFQAAFNAYKSADEEDGSANPGFGMFPKYITNSINRLIQSDPELIQFWKDFEPSTALSEVNAGNINEVIGRSYKNEQEVKARSALLTATVGWTHSSHTVSSLRTDLRFLRALNKYNPDKNPWNFEAYVTYQADNDTIIAETDLNERQVFSVGANIAKVLLSDSEGNAQLELKGGISHESILEGAYDNENDQEFNLNWTLTIQIAKNLYLPIEVKVDPDGNTLGFLNLAWNFDNRE